MTLALLLFKNSNDTREKLRLNFHSLSVSVSELLEYGRMLVYVETYTNIDKECYCIFSNSPNRFYSVDIFKP